MRSIGARIAVWYACAATATLALLFAAGYVLLERQLLRGLDLLCRLHLRLGYLSRWRRLIHPCHSSLMRLRIALLTHRP